MQILGGLCQSSGWPSVVSIMANWFGKGKRGLVMGIWNAHTSVGNIAGSVMASMLLPPFCSWGWAFIAPGIFMFVAATLVWYFLVPQPENVGIAPSYQKVASKVGGRQHVQCMHAGGGAGLLPFYLCSSWHVHCPYSHFPYHLLASDTAFPINLSDDGCCLATAPHLQDEETPRPKDDSSNAPRGISFLTAWAIPGVTPFALCLFFSKLVAYTFLYWLPFYIKSTGPSPLSPLCHICTASHPASPPFVTWMLSSLQECDLTLPGDTSWITADACGRLWTTLQKLPGSLCQPAKPGPSQSFLTWAACSGESLRATCRTASARLRWWHLCLCTSPFRCCTCSAPLVSVRGLPH